MKLFRKRLIPEEMIELKKDRVLYRDSNILITKWEAIRPKIDLHHGISCYFLSEGYKVSKFYSVDNTLLYWYCDIIIYQYNATEDCYIFTDLLADVIIYPDGFVKVVDMDELAEMFEKDGLEKYQVCACLRQLNTLLQIIYSGKFKELQKKLEEWE